MSNPHFVYLSGEVIEASKATVSIFDYGFLFGAGVYDVALLYNGLIFQAKEHLDRFFNSAKSIGVPIKESKEEIVKIINDLVAKNDLKEGIVYLQATFGAYGKRSHKLPADVSHPTLVIFTQHLAPYPYDFFTQGVKLTTEPEFRWTRCNIKAVTLLPALLAINALPDGVAESVFYDPEKKTIRECAASNIFCVKNKVIYTPPLSKYILPGIERQTIINTVREYNSKKKPEEPQLELKEEDFDLDFFMQADEVFMSSSTKEVLPVRQVDDKIFKAPGEITKKLMLFFVEYVEKELKMERHPKRDIVGLF